MATYWYAVVFDEYDDKKIAIAFYIGKTKPLDENDIAQNPRLTGIMLWLGKMPRIMHEYDLERLEEKGYMVIELDPRYI